MISRVLGLIREAVVAALFGASTEYDAFLTAFRIPNLLRDLFAEGALSAAFVPTFTAALKRDGPEAAWRLANAVIGVLVIVLGALTVLIILGARPLVVFLAPGFRQVPGKVELTADLTRVMSPFLLFVALAAVMMGVLNVFHRFFLPSLAPAVFNLVNIAVTLALYPVARSMGLSPIHALAVGALTGVAAQFLIQLPVAYRLGFRLKPRTSFGDPGVRRMAALMLPAAIGLAATQINILVDSQFASHWQGAQSWLAYAFRLMYLPIGLIGVAIGTANLARVSHDAAAGDIDGLRRRVAGSMRLTLALALPATAGLIALREPIIATIYQRRSFRPEDTLATASVLLYYAIGLSAYSCLKVVVPTFYALGDTKTPVRVSFLSVAVKVASSFALVPFLKVQGLALSTSLVACLSVAVLWALLGRRVGGFRGLGVGGLLVRSTAVSVVMGVVCALLWSLAPPALRGGMTGAAWLLAVVVFGIALVVILSALAGVEEVGHVVSLVRERFAKRRAS